MIPWKNWHYQQSERHKKEETKIGKNGMTKTKTEFSIAPNS